MQNYEKNKLHDTAALRALSAEDIDAYVPEATDAHQAVDLNANHGGGETKTPRRVPVRQATQQKFSYQRMHANHMQFRKIAIPALCGVGFILWAIAGLTFWMRSNIAPEEAAKNPLLVNSDMFMWICIILGFALIGGAVVFIIEVKKHGGKK
ncbi:MAG: hypothetical protein KAR11_01795 [Phycisphaerae bacterium]|nr:hypothetical protein [Phycisphaerae bacterium]